MITLMSDYAGDYQYQDCLDLTKDILISLCLEDWCTDTCQGEWKIEGSGMTKVGFTDHSDYVIYLLTTYRDYSTGV